MRVIGITNKLSHNLRVFMWEFDEVDEFDAFEEANFISQVFDIDVYVLESSKGGNYHLVSFDILSLETVAEIQRWITHEGDYIPIDEMNLYDDKGLWNTLRVGKKFQKPNPKFLKVFRAENNKHSLSLAHYLFYRFFCGIPEITMRDMSRAVNLEPMISVYNTGSKPKPRRTFILHKRVIVKP